MDILLNNKNVDKNVDKNEIELDPREHEEFKSLVKEWITLDDNIRKLETYTRDMKKKKNILTPMIMDFMSSKNIMKCNDEEGTLTCSTKTRVKPLNKITIRAKMIEYFKNIDQGEKAANFLMENRDKEEIMKLERKFNKKDKIKVNQEKKSM